MTCLALLADKRDPHIQGHSSHEAELDPGSVLLIDLKEHGLEV